MEAENSLISHCEPDLQLFKIAGCEVNQEMNFFGSTTSPDRLWHIRNQGNLISTTLGGTNDADGDICECWGVAGLMGSNYLTPTIDSIRYDVIAPGTQIRTALTNNPTTSPSYQNGYASGTSLASPVVAGVAAIILSKYPNLTYNEVINTINDNAEKIKSGSTYNYNSYSFLPGYNNETFYGRVSCITALQNPVVGIKENKKDIDGIKFSLPKSK